jgi:hypothetical protein
MRRDDLVCANCAGRVSEGRCPVCRVTRNRQDPSSGGFRTPLWVFVALLAMVICTLALENRFA